MRRLCTFINTYIVFIERVSSLSSTYRLEVLEVYYLIELTSSNKSKLLREILTYRLSY